VAWCSFEEAEALARRSLVIRERSFGSDDPLTASSLNNLALLLKDANHLEEAETMCRKCIDIRCKLTPALCQMLTMERLGQHRRQQLFRRKEKKRLLHS